METTTTTTSSSTEKGAPPLPPPKPASDWRLSGLDAFLRVLLLAASVVIVVVVTTSKQTKELFPGTPFSFYQPAKFNYSPAFIYLVAAFSIAILYSLVTGLASFSVLWKPNVPAKWLLILITLDVLMLGILASATGTAGGVAYIGLKGNSHVQWLKICNLYGRYCRYVGSSVVVALFASFVLVLLIISNACSLYRRIEPKC